MKASTPFSDKELERILATIPGCTDTIHDEDPIKFSKLPEDLHLESEQFKSHFISDKSDVKAYADLARTAEAIYKAIAPFVEPENDLFGQLDRDLAYALNTAPDGLDQRTALLVKATQDAFVDEAECRERMWELHRNAVHLSRIARQKAKGISTRSKSTERRRITFLVGCFVLQTALFFKCTANANPTFYRDDDDIEFGYSGNAFTYFNTVLACIIHENRPWMLDGRIFSPCEPFQRAV